ncbi:MAG: hypothetical protein IT371_26470 [Deltaproteobacteria bacterium]|nr:hypothetical protein [Deltaproteobacteria bacterium]
MLSIRRASILTALLALAAQSAWARNVTLEHQGFAVTLPAAKAQRLARDHAALAAAQVPHYLNLFRWTTGELRGQMGATIVAVVNDAATLTRWHEAAGCRTIGYQDYGTPAHQEHTGWGRIGRRSWPFNFIQHKGELPYATAWEPHGATWVDVGFEASAEEQAAATAFNAARALGLVVDRQGNPIRPRVSYSTTKGIFKVEGCASASSSMLEPAWQAAFARSLPRIQAYAAEHPDVAELQGVNAGTLATLRAFAARTGARQWPHPKYFVTKNYGADALSLITVVNAAISDPLALAWDLRPTNGKKGIDGWLTIGAGARTIPDLPAGKKGSSFENRRVGSVELPSLFGAIEAQLASAAE